jgi:hypothetical protein
MNHPIQKHQVTAIKINRMTESCERTTYYVELISDENFEMTVASHETGSVYTDHKGLSVEEARDRALIDAANWGDFLGIEPVPYIENGVTYEPSMTFEFYQTRREID